MKTVILGSGEGTNANAIVQAQSSQLLGNAKVVAILSDKQESGILEIAKSHKIENRYLDPGSFNTKFDEKSEQVWIESIRNYVPDLIVLAGFMRILNTPFLNAFPGMILNLHPSLLPSFEGLHAIDQAFDYGVKITGCTVHWVNDEVDAGKIIAQGPVRIMQGDTIEMARQKIQGVEHMLLPAVIRDLSIGAVPFPAL
jgi:phosphoribosylglycinamide formyltransferase-1